MTKRLLSKTLCSRFILLISVSTFVSCVDTETESASTNKSINNAPTVSDVSIIDDNAGNAEVDDILSSHYQYKDLEDDAEGNSTYRWLRNGTAISGTSAKDYTLVAADSGQIITVEITPIAKTGTLTGEAVLSDTGITVAEITASKPNSVPTVNDIGITDVNGGNAEVGDILTGYYSYADVEDDAEGESRFRWLRNGSAIDGATTKSYTLVIIDIGEAITFEVTPVAQTGNTTGSAEKAVSEINVDTPIVVNTAPIASNVGIDLNGNAVIGSLLTGTYTYSDVDGDVEGNSTYRWLRNGATISGASAKNYTLVAADSGQNIRFEITPIAKTGTTKGKTIISDDSINVANTAPVASNVGIDLNGNAVIGSLLTGTYTYSDVDGDVEGNSTYRWLRNGATISGASAKNYTLVAVDSEQNIRFEITPIAKTGITKGKPVISDDSINVANTAPVASNVGIDLNGDAAIGSLLTGTYTYADVDGDAEANSTYRWLRNGVAISGASAKSYTLVTADSDQSIRFEVTPVAKTGTTKGKPVISDDSISVANIAPVASNVGISLSGNAAIGSLLTGTYTYADVNGDAEGNSTYRWLRNGATISGASAKNYTLVAADSEQNIRFEITPIAKTGTTKGKSVISDDSINVANTAPVASNVGISLSGNAAIGSLLTGTYTYADADSDAEGNSTYRWLRNGATISGASAKSYTLVTTDSDQSIRFEVTPVAKTGITKGKAVISDDSINVANTAPVASNVGISLNGNAAIGSLLTGTYTYADVNGDAEGNSTYRWLRNGAAISGASAKSYTLVAVDSEQNIRFEITPIAKTGTTKGKPVISDDSISVANIAPVASNVGISLSGNAAIGSLLTGTYTYTDVNGDAEGNSTYRWLRNGATISGASAKNYTLVAADSEQNIRFEVTPIAKTGTVKGKPVISDNSINVGNTAPVANDVRIIDNNGGYAVIDDVLTGAYTYTDADNNPEGTSTLQWFKNGIPVAGATSNTYTLGINDRQKKITFRVIPIAASGVATGSPVTSAQLVTGTPPVINGPAKFLDIDTNGLVNAGDQLIIPVDQVVYVNSATADGSDFDLPVEGDSLGIGASVKSGPGSYHITITLGTSPRLTVFKDYNGVNTENSPSGIDISNTMKVNVIKNISTGFDAQSSQPVDIMPGFVLTQSLNVGNASSIALGDINNDGFMDIVVGLDVDGYTSPGAKVFINNGKGVFTEVAQGSWLTIGGGKAEAVVLGDLDGDGDLDLVLGGSWRSDLSRAFINDGKGVFLSGGANASFAKIRDSNMVLADLDNDDDLDVLIGFGLMYENITTASDQLAGKLMFKSSVWILNSSTLDTGDINGDGFPDIVANILDKNLTNGIKIMTSDSVGHFSDDGYISADNVLLPNADTITLGDLDNDNDLDILISRITGNPSLILMNDGRGNFTLSEQQLVTQSAYGKFVEFTDIDNDGDTDIIYSPGDRFGLAIYINDGNTVFTDAKYAGHFAIDIAIADVDKDGDMDMIEISSGETKVYFNSLK